MEAGCALTPSEIVITHGATEAIYLSLQAVTKPGDTVAIESPAYYNLLEILNALHLKALELPTHPQTGVSLLANGGYDRHLRQLRRAFELQVDRMSQAVCTYFPAETKMTRPQGDFVLWLELPTEFEALVLYEEALAHNIQIAPGVMFSPSENYRNCFLLNCGLPWSSKIEQAMQTIGTLCKRQLAKKILGV